LRTDPERIQDDGEDKKAEDQTDIAALARRETQIMTDQAEEGVHQTASSSAAGTAKSSSARLIAPVIASGWAVPTATLPPASRCAAITAASRASPSLSSAAPGSSRSQIG